MNISLTPELENWVLSKVESGLYISASEVIREGLRLLKEQEQLKEIRLNELRQQIQKGIDSGESTPLDMNEVRALARQKQEQNKGV